MCSDFALAKRSQELVVIRALHVPVVEHDWDRAQYLDVYTIPVTFLDTLFGRPAIALPLCGEWFLSTIPDIVGTNLDRAKKLAIHDHIRLARFDVVQLDEAIVAILFG